VTNVPLRPPPRGPWQRQARAPFAHVPAAEWNDWQWQQQSRLRTAEEVERYLPLTDDERRACAEATSRFRMAVTPYYLSLVDPSDPNDPIRRQAIPQLAELTVHPSEREDPLAEESHSPVPGITHRYPDRVLFYTTHNCPVYCRHCFRKRKVSDPTSAQSRLELDRGIAYIAAHPEVRDVLVSGGDPLTFSDERLVELLGSLRRIPHVEILRIATRNPVTLPQRVTPELAAILRAHHPIYVHTHFNHLRECTDEAALALELLADAGCVLNNQMVLLAGVNDDAAMVKRMNQWLLARRCQPYYMFQCDAAEGISHFRTPIRRGLEIIDELRGWTSGMAVPHYVVDLTGGGGKVSLVPEHVVQRVGKTWTFRNFRGELFDYEEG
jgi:lysine 2,3-aminomutase